MKETLPKYASDPEEAVEFMEKMGYFPEKYEKVFLKDAECAYRYANLLENRLPEHLEKVFLKSPEYAFEYAYYILDERLPTNLEKVFLKSPQYAYEYAEKVIKGRLPVKLEKVFIKDALYANLYVKNILRDQLDEDIHNKILMSGICGSSEKVAKYLKTCQGFKDDFINYIKSNNLYDVLVQEHIDDHWKETFYNNNLEYLSEHSHVIYNKLRKLKRNIKFKDILHE